MMQRAFFSAFAAIFLSAVLIQTAAAYPTSATSARSTFSGSYRPLDFDLNTLVDGTDALDYDFTTLSFEVVLTGTFTGDGYPVSGQAGDWRLILSNTFDPDVTSSFDFPNNIYLLSSGAGDQVGTLTYEGGHTVDSGSLQPGDTPQIGDVFTLFSTAAGAVLTVNCVNILTCNDFDLTLVQPLNHLGPFTGGEFPDIARTNEDCLVRNDQGQVTGFTACGSFTDLTASSVPEPATLALLGLGLVGLGLSRRARA